MTISTHVLDLTRGRPQADLRVRLEHHGAQGWAEIAESHTDTDGRIRGWDRDIPGSGHFRFVIHSGSYFEAMGSRTLFPEVTVTFLITDPSRDTHIPLLLSPYGYCVYQGS